MSHLDPTYLRYIYDNLIKGSVHSENASELPEGLIGLYEEAFEEHLPVMERQLLLKRFAFFAILKKEVSTAFVAEVLEEREEDVKEFILNNRTWFNSPEPGKFQLYHERLKVYVLQKLSEKEILTIHEKLIVSLERAIEKQQADEFERYALEFLSEHYYVEAILSGDGQKLADLAYSQSHWQRQLKISKGYTWTKNGLKAVMTWASKYNDDEVIECGLQMVDLHHQEQNDAPQIVALVADGDFENVLNRIEQFGGNDKEGLQRKFILYMLCLMELTLLDSKDKPNSKDGIEKLLKHLDENLSVDHSLLNWGDFFPSYTMFLIVCELDILELDYLIIYKRTNYFEFSWINKKCSWNDNQYFIILNCVNFINYDKEKNYALIIISNLMASQGKVKQALETARGIIDISFKIGALKDISSELFTQGKYVEATSIILEALESVKSINDELDKSIALKEISIELAKQGKCKEANECVHNVADEYCKRSALEEISIELAKKGKFKESFEIVQEIQDELSKSYVLKNISIELAKKEDIEVAVECAHRISDDSSKSFALQNISSELAKHGKFTEAIECVQGVIDDNFKNSAIQEISYELAKQGEIDKALELTYGITNEFIKISSLRQLSRVINSNEILQNALDLIFAIKGDISIYLEKGNELKLLAFECYKRGLINDYYKLLNGAFEIFSSLSYDNFDRYGILTELALELTEIGDFVNVKRAITNLRYRGEKESVLKNISNRESELENVKNSSLFIYELLNINTIWNENEIDNLLSDISIKFSQNKATENALIIAGNIIDDFNNSYVVSQIALDCLKFDNAELGIKLVLEIKDINHIATACEKVAKELIKSNCFDLALGLLEQLSYKIEYDQTYFLSEIFTRFYKLKQYQLADVLLKKINEKGIVLEVNSEKIKQLLIVYTDFIKSEYIKEADALILEILNYAKEIMPESDRNVAFKIISIEFTKLNKIEEAIECLQYITSDRTRRRTKRDISIELTKQGNIIKAFEFVNEISDEREKDAALKDISTELCKQGLIEEAFKCVREMKNEYSKNEVLKDISIELSNQGKIEQALLIARGVSNESFRRDALQRISYQLVNQGDIDKAENIILEIPIKDKIDLYWKSIVSDIYQKNGWLKVCKTFNQLKFDESRLYYFKSWVESIEIIDVNNSLIKASLPLIYKFPESMENLMRKYALNQLFFGDTIHKQIAPLNQVLNLQWAIDIKNQLQN